MFFVRTFCKERRLSRGTATSFSPRELRRPREFLAESPGMPCQGAGNWTRKRKMNWKCTENMKKTEGENAYKCLECLQLADLIDSPKLFDVHVPRSHSVSPFRYFPFTWKHRAHLAPQPEAPTAKSAIATYIWWLHFEAQMLNDQTRRVDESDLANVTFFICSFDYFTCLSVFAMYFVANCRKICCAESYVKLQTLMSFSLKSFPLRPGVFGPQSKASRRQKPRYLKLTILKTATKQ